MALELEAGVFHFQFAQHVEEALLVGLLLRRDRQPLHRLRELQRLQVNADFALQVVQHTIELDFLDFGDGPDVTRNQLADFDIFLAEQAEQVADLERTFGVADEKLRILFDRPLMYTEDTQLADEGIAHHFENVRQHMLAGVRNGVEGYRIGSTRRALVEGRRIALIRIGSQFAQHVEELTDADASFCRNKQDRDQMPVTQGLGERGDQRLGRGVFTVLQVFGQQVFVFLDDLVDDGAVGFGD